MVRRTMVCVLWVLGQTTAPSVTMFRSTFPWLYRASDDDCAFCRWTSTSPFPCCSACRRTWSTTSCWTKPPSATVPWSRCATWLPSPCRPTRPPSTARASLSTPCWVRRLSWTDNERAATDPCVSRWGVTGRLKGIYKGSETHCRGEPVNIPLIQQLLLPFSCVLRQREPVLVSNGTDVSPWEMCPFFFIIIIFGCFQCFKIWLNIYFFILILKACFCNVKVLWIVIPLNLNIFLDFLFTRLVTRMTTKTFAKRMLTFGMW